MASLFFSFSPKGRVHPLASNVGDWINETGRTAEKSPLIGRPKTGFYYATFPEIPKFSDGKLKLSINPETIGPGEHADDFFLRNRSVGKLGHIAIGGWKWPLFHDHFRHCCRCPRAVDLGHDDPGLCWHRLHDVPPALERRGRGLTEIKSRIQSPPSGGLFVWLVTPLPAGGISTNERCLRRVQSKDIEVFAS